MVISIVFFEGGGVLLVSEGDQKNFAIHRENKMSPAMSASD